MSITYRIMTDHYSGFEVQYRSSWWPFWRQCLGSSSPVNTHKTVEDAEAFAEYDARRRLPPVCVKVLGEIRVNLTGN